MSQVHRTIIKVTVLHEKPLPDELSLGEIAHEISDGSWLGDWEIDEAEILTDPDEIVGACEDVRNDGSFFEDVIEEIEDAREREQK